MEITDSPPLEPVLLFVGDEIGVEIVAEDVGVQNPVYQMGGYGGSSSADETHHHHAAINGRTLLGI